MADFDFKEKFDELNNTADTTGEFDPGDVQQNKTMAILAYIGPLVLITIFGAKESKFARFHANQGLVLLIAEAIGWIAVGIVSAILGAIPVIKYFLPFIIETLFSAVCALFIVLGIVNAAKGKAKELPLFGKIRILK